jgi:hypothetical protein
MKKNLFLLLALFILNAVSVNAQVTIGSTSDPHSGAVLDLQSTTQGLKLSTIALDDDLTVFGLPLSGTSTKANAKGMFVYNTNTNIGEGIYVWDGSQWGLVKGSVGANPVTSITVTAADDATSLVFGTTLQLTATIEPYDASNPHIDWTIAYGIGNATINASGLLTGVRAGLITVYAFASNGVFGQIDLTVTNSGEISIESIGDNDYRTYNFGGTTWMIDYSKEGTPNYTYYGEGDADDTNDKEVGERGYYYNITGGSGPSANALTACSDEWFLPAKPDWDILMAYFNSAAATQAEKELFGDPTGMNGEAVEGVWGVWGTRHRWVLDDKFHYGGVMPVLTWQDNSVSDSATRSLGVRCIKKN